MRVNLGRRFTLNTTLEALAAEKRELEARRERKGPIHKKKHLLRHMVKKVLIHDRRTVEVWYGLPNQTSVRTPGHLAP